MDQESKERSMRSKKLASSSLRVGENAGEESAPI